MARLARNYMAERPHAYRQLWRVVDGAVFDALYNHPDYLTDKGRRNARESINKRVVGAVYGYALEAQGRSLASEAADREERLQSASSRTVPTLAVSKAGRLGKSFLARIFGRAPC